ncbi:aldehyde dehydrogenase family protein [Amycolatopsis magusensis]|uniref:aldehyde dehydrogenase family protein n=1 Tax=Amycolatopsis magusensis TaxID=882444 RepID=UPI0024A97679|nr:aldehyde dehydrogenase family protein [Amycolatopsis magusensis]MDI5976894.1 aldehyde dehydrogenase family protein [Amycolatopsis magusensis]
MMRYPDGLPIGTGWVSTSDTEPVRFPFDGSVVAQAPVGTAELARRALDEAVTIAPEVAALPSRTRRAVLSGVRDRLADRQDELVELLVAETGKPLVDCRVEVARTLVTWEAAAEEVARLHGETVPLDLLPSGDGLVGFWTRKPIGVVVGIAGFNYPLLLASHKIAPSIAAGCPVVAKPAPATPLATLWLVHLVREAAAEAGAPVSMVQLVTGDVEVGSTLVTDPRVGAVSFTGSAAVGHRIARDAAPRKTLLELGSNAALVVAEDADLDAAADAVLRGGFYASGQACISVQRLLVVDSVADEFTGKLLARLGEVVIGDPREETTRVSALIDERSTRRVLDWVEQAVGAGAKVLGGGGAEGGIVRPTVLADVPEDADCWAEEIFGPVVCLRRVSDVDEAFELVNASRYGLHASVFSRSLNTAFRALDRLEVGGVVVNEVPGFRSDTMPYGGVKDSGIGREGPRFAVEELTVTRMAVIRP